MSRFYVVNFRHSPKEDGKYRQMETVYHLHGDTDGYDNHRCIPTKDGNYFCPGCKQSFNKEEINRYPYRDLPHSKSYWLESRRSGQHLPHNEKDVFWTHMHPQDDMQKKKVGEVDFSGIFASCQACDKILNLHTWQESHPDKKQLVFPGIVMENISVSIWKELKIFLEENVEIWLQDKDGKFFFLSNQLQLLTAKNQEGILVCGDRLFLDNDDRKCLLFQVEKISQEMIDENLKEKTEPIEDFHLEIKMAAEAEIPKKPESRRRSTKELSSGELAGLQTPPEREQSQEIIVIVNGENAETHKIPKHYKVDLDETTPLPEEAHPLLVPDSVTDETGENSNEDDWEPTTVMVMDNIPKMIITTERAVISGEISMPETSPTMNVAESRDGVKPMALAMTDEASNAKPKASFPQTLELCLQGIQPLNDTLNPVGETPDPLETDTNRMLEQEIVADAGLLPTPDFSETEDQWFAEMEPPVEEMAEPSSAEVATDGKPATSAAEAPLPETNDSPDDEQTAKKELDKALESAKLAEDEATALAKLAMAEAKMEQLEEVCIQLMMQTQLTNASNATSTVAEATTDTNEAETIEQENTMPLGDASSFAKASDDKPDGKPTTVLPTMTELPLPETDNSLADEQSVKEALDKALAKVLVTTALPTTEEMSSDYSLPETIHSKEQANSTEPSSRESDTPVLPHQPLNEEPKPATENAPSAPNNAVWREAMIKTALTGIAFVVVVMLSTGFAWMINYFQRDDLKDELKAAELRRAEIASQTNESQVKADLTRFDLMETRQATERLQKELSAMEEQKKRLAEEIDSLEKRQVNIWAWQADVQEFLVKANNQLQTNFAKLKDETRNNQLAWQRQEREHSDLHWNALFKQNKELISQQTLFAKKWENKLQELLKQPSQVQEPPFGLGLDFNVRTKAKTFCPEFLQAVIKWQAGIKKQVQLKMAEDKNKRKKEAATLLVLKTPLLLDISKFLTQNNPPLVDKSTKTSPKTAVDKSQKTLVIKAEKSAGKPNQKTSKKDQETVYKMEDLVHVWTGPTYF